MTRYEQGFVVKYAEEMEKRGFTLVELLTVLPLLAAAGYGGYRGVKATNNYVKNNQSDAKRVGAGAAIGAAGTALGSAVVAALGRRKNIGQALKILRNAGTKDLGRKMLKEELGIIGRKARNFPRNLAGATVGGFVGHATNPDNG